MDTILDKFGLYDVFGILIPGIIINFFISFLYYNYFIDVKLIDFINCFNGQVILVMAISSYILGLIFHEFGVVIQKIPPLHFNDATIYKKNKNIISQLCGKINKIDSLLDSDDIDSVIRYFIIKIKSKDSYANINKRNSIFGMSRTLFSFFGIATLAILFISLCDFIKYPHIINNNLFILITFIALTIIFFIRTRRYAKIRFIDIIYTYILLDD